MRRIGEYGSVLSCFPDYCKETVESLLNVSLAPAFLLDPAPLSCLRVPATALTGGGVVLTSPLVLLLLLLLHLPLSPLCPTVLSARAPAPPPQGTRSLRGSFPKVAPSK